MVSPRVALAAALIAAVPGWAEPPPPPLSAIVVKQNGARSDAVSGDETAGYCSRFRLNSADVAAFFAKAAPVDEQAYVHDLDMSRCHVAGIGKAESGASARWTIDLARRGAIMVPGQPTRYVYCLSCTNPLFDAVDAETRDAATSLIARARAAR